MYDQTIGQLLEPLAAQYAATSGAVPSTTAPAAPGTRANPSVDPLTKALTPVGETLRRAAWSYLNSTVLGGWGGAIANTAVAGMGVLLTAAEHATGGAAQPDEFLIEEHLERLPQSPRPHSAFRNHFAPGGPQNVPGRPGLWRTYLYYGPTDIIRRKGPPAEFLPKSVSPVPVMLWGQRILLVPADKAARDWLVAQRRKDRLTQEQQNARLAKERADRLAAIAQAVNSLNPNAKTVFKAYESYKSEGLTDNQIVARIIQEALVLEDGNVAKAFGLIYEIRNQYDDILDNQILASADHFFQLWLVQDQIVMYKDPSGPPPLTGSGVMDFTREFFEQFGSRANYLASKLLPMERIGGGIGAIIGANGLVLGKLLGVDTGRDNPKIPPSELTALQALWGYRAVWAAFRYPTNMWPSSREWKSFVAWLDSIK